MKFENKEFGTYRLLNLIGNGPTAQVWLANHTILNRSVVLKLLCDPESTRLERFRQEVQLLGQLEHPNILPVVDYGPTEGYLYIVMPLVAGGTLQEYLRHQSLSRGHAFEVFGQLLNGLSQAHRKGIVHANLKPSNVMLHADGRVAITDFGLAATLGMNEDVSKTLTGTVLGSPEYMAPEQFLGNSELRSDLYSSGVVLYELLTGHPPYEGTSAWELGMRHLNDPLPLPHPLIPASFESFFTRALHKRPARRFDSVEEMALAFRNAAAQVSQAQLAVRPLVVSESARNAPEMHPVFTQDTVVTPTLQPVAVAAPVEKKAEEMGKLLPAKAPRSASYMPIGEPVSNLRLAVPSVLEDTKKPNLDSLAALTQPLRLQARPLASVSTMPPANVAAKKPDSVKAPAVKVPEPGKRKRGRINGRRCLVAAMVSGWLLTAVLAMALVIVVLQTGWLK